MFVLGNHSMTMFPTHELRERATSGDDLYRLLQNSLYGKNCYISTQNEMILKIYDGRNFYSHLSVSNCTGKPLKIPSEMIKNHIHIENFAIIGKGRHRKSHALT